MKEHLEICKIFSIKLSTDTIYDGILLEGFETEIGSNMLNTSHMDRILLRILQEIQEEDNIFTYLYECYARTKEALLTEKQIDSLKQCLSSYFVQFYANAALFDIKVGPSKISPYLTTMHVNLRNAFMMGAIGADTEFIAMVLSQDDGSALFTCLFEVIRIHNLSIRLQQYNDLTDNAHIVYSLLSKNEMLKQIYVSSPTFIPQSASFSENSSDLGSFLRLSATNFADNNIIDNEFGPGPYYFKGIESCQELIANKLIKVANAAYKIFNCLLEYPQSKDKLLKWICITLNENKEALKMQPNVAKCASEGDS